MVAGDFSSSRSIYGGAHERFQKIAGTAVFYMFKVTVPMFTIPAMIQSYMTYNATGDADTSFRLAFDAKLPYNWKTPGTYFVTIVAQIVAFTNTGNVYVGSFVMFFGICTYLVALGEDFKEHLKILDCYITDPSITAYKLKYHFHKLIEFHATSKELSYLHFCDNNFCHLQ